MKSAKFMRRRETKQRGNAAPGGGEHGPSDQMYNSKTNREAVARGARSESHRINLSIIGE
jgi:hypothetical protein